MSADFASYNSRYRALEMEMTFAAEMLYMAKDALTDARDILPPEALLDSFCRSVYRAACAVQDRGGSLDEYTIREELRRIDPQVDDGFCRDLRNFAVTAANIVPQSRTILAHYETGMLRELLGQTIADMPPIADAQAVIADLESKFRQICKPHKSAIINVDEVGQHVGLMRQELEVGTYSAYVETGFNTLDMALGGGMIRGGFYVVAARPGVGKTAIGLAIAEKVCAQKKRVMFVSLEMRPEELTARFLAMKTGVGSTRILVEKHLGLEDTRKLVDAICELPGTSLFYNRRPRATVTDIAYMTRKADADLLVIDYLGLIRPEDDRRSRYEQITNISGALKAMAIDLNIPILCLAQLNREVQNIHDKPKLSDIRDSGAIEQDADGVLLLYRASDEEDDGTVILSATVEKNRHGRGGAEISFLYRPVINRITEIVEGPPDPGDEDMPF